MAVTATVLPASPTFLQPSLQGFCEEQGIVTSPSVRVLYKGAYTEYSDDVFTLGALRNFIANHRKGSLRREL